MPSIVILFAFILQNISGFINAAPMAGDLDQTFGKDGYVFTDFFSSTDVLNSVIIDKNNQIVVAGGASAAHNEYFALARYGEKGQLDKSFGKNGFVTTHKLDDYAWTIEGIQSSGMQSDGKIIVCGRGYVSHATGMLVLRYHENGMLDESFGLSGIFFLADDERPYHPLSLAIDKNDQIVVASANFDNAARSDFVIHRLDPQGGLDLDFGDHGSTTTHITAGTNVPRVVRIDESGNIIVGGFTGTNKFVVVRYLSSGVIDTSFGHAGASIITFNSNGIDTLNALIIQPDGKILVGGDVQVGSFAGLRMIDFGIARLTPSGEIDTTFNHGGTVIIPFLQKAASSLWALALDANNKILAVGDALVVKGIAIARLNQDGSLDDSFAQNGKQVTVLGKTCHWEAASLQKDGKIIVGGYVFNGKHYDMALARFNP